MSQEQFEQFRQLVLDDLSLQRELQGFTERDVFVERAVELGAARGLHFTAAEVVEAIRASRREWSERSI